MIDCPNGDVRDLLPDFLHGRLDPAMRAEVQRHLAGCEACREELSLLGDLRATLARAPRVSADAIAASIPPYRAPVRLGWATGWRTAAAIAAIAVGGTSISLLRDGGADADRSPVPAVGSGAERVAGSGSRAVVAASPDGSRSTSAGAGVERSTGGVPARRADAGELAMAVGAIGELSDGELSTLVEGIESLEALPSVEVEGPGVVAAGVEEVAP